MSQPNERNLRSILSLTLGALGVVYGDIGTSPLYAVRQCFSGAHALPLTQLNILGVMSLIFWALVFVISLKYLLFVMSADNNGEGGILALVALAFPKQSFLSRSNLWLLTVGLFGAALLFSDGMITPAISVLSAVEGLTVAAPSFDLFVLPVTIGILILLFVLQRFGTSRVGRTFGPIILVWFFAIAILGVYNLAQDLRVLRSVNPYYAFEFFAHNGWKAFVLMGTVFLVVTGGEALYADMGHFGKAPIRLGWFSLVFPALLLNYFGQGALLLRDPMAAENPFFLLAPEPLLYPTIAIATLATIIASQAIISGTFSLTHQAVQLGYLPRIGIIHTSEVEKGQIYVPSINWLLLLATVFLVLFFRSSGNLAGAYGVAITCTMVATTILAAVIARRLWKWRLGLVVAVAFPFLFIDFSFLAANLTKIPSGGWFALVIGTAILSLMITWKRGRQFILRNLREKIVPLESFIGSLESQNLHRVEGIAVFLTSVSDGTPLSILHNIKHNKVLHETNVILTIIVEDVPDISWEEKFKVTNWGAGIYTLRVRYGFMESVSIPTVLMRCQADGLKLNLSEITYFLGRETLVVTGKSKLSQWERILFERLSRNAQFASDFFKLPPDQVFEIGTQVEL